MFYISILMFLIGIITAIIALRNGLLLLFFFQLAYILLVCGQAVWFSAEDQMLGDVLVGYSSFNQSDALTLTIYFLLFQFGISLILLKLSYFRTQMNNNNIFFGKINPQLIVNEKIENLLYVPIIVIICPAMIINAGGFYQFIYSPGALLPGQTFLIIILGILKWNILSRIINQININTKSVLLYSVYILFTLFTSRFLTVFAFIQLVLFYHYYKNKVKTSSIILVLISSIFVIVIYGIFRDLASRDVLRYANFGQIIDEVLDFLPYFFDWFYTSNIEIFIGSADAVRRLREGVPLDYLISELNFVFNFLPNAIKTSEYFNIKEFIEYFTSVGSSSNSVVSSGFERYLLGLGSIGFFLYSFLILWFLTIAEKALLLKNINFSSITSIHAINGLRGSLISILTFFGVAEVLGNKIFSLCCYKSSVAIQK